MNIKKILALSLAFVITQADLNASSDINTADTTRLAGSPQIFNNDVQIGQNATNKRRNFEVTKNTYLREDFVLGSGANSGANGQPNEGVNERHLIFDFNPSTQLLCIEFFNSGAAQPGAMISELFFTGNAQSGNTIEPVMTYVSEIFINNGTNVSASNWFGNYNSIDQFTGESPNSGANLNNLSFSQHLPASPTNNKIYVGLYQCNDKKFYAQYPSTFDYSFNKGTLFVHIKSANVKNITVVDLPNTKFKSLSQALRNYMHICLEEKWIFQVWRVGEVIANNATTKTNLESLASLVDPENVPADTNYQNLCTQVTNIWSNLFNIL
ncbi:hypothetical protein IPF37_06745 [bacterium]|nr:MAG: hypothetical protein IPF37_06745 [bacterium]